MASNCEGSFLRGSDLFFDFPCFTCQGNDKNSEAEFYCKACSKLYCGECVEYHNILYKKHVTLGKENKSQWPFPPVSLDVLGQCQEHKNELTAFCENHSELLSLSRQPIIKMKKSKIFCVRMTSDSHECKISGICETATGLLIADMNNKKMKLLGQDYKVVAHCDLPNAPLSICSIDPSLVAVTVARKGVYFIRVTNYQLVQERTIKPDEYCLGIAHHKGILYITSGSTLDKCRMDGTRLCIIYNDESSSGTVTYCAIGQDENRIYVASRDYHALSTLNRYGKEISTLGYPALELDEPSTNLLYDLNVTVTSSGQVLVCYGDFNKVLRVDRDGRQNMAELVTEKDGVISPTSVYYSKHTRTLVVGMKDNDNIMVFTQFDII